MTISRRQFLASGAALAAMPYTNTLAASSVPAPPIIDAHIHVWELDQLNPPWLASAAPILRKRYMAEEYRQATAGLNIAQAVYVEIAESNDRRPGEAKFVVDLIQSARTPLIAAVIGGDPASDTFEAYVRHFAKIPQVKGVRCFYPKGADTDEKFLAGIRLLGELGLSFDLVLGVNLLQGAAKLVKACPHTKFILDHCGSGSPNFHDPQLSSTVRVSADAANWFRGLEALAANENVACKISGVAEQTKSEPTPRSLAPIVNRCLDSFGQDRVLFASNWPVCLQSITLAKWLQAVQEIAAPRGEKFAAKLFRENARQWYRLKD